MTDLRELARLEPLFWRAPSAHNTQPWLLDYGAHRVELSYDPARALPAGDPTQRDLLLSLGAFVETVLIASAEHGVPLEFVPNVAELGVGAFVRASAPYETRFTTRDLDSRQTSRLAYARGRLSGDQLAAARNEIRADSDLHELETGQLSDLVEVADLHLYESRHVIAELRAWLRLERGHPRYELDGLTDECLALGRAEATTVRVLLSGPVYPLVLRLGLHRRFSAATRRLLENDGSALVLAGAADSPERMMEQGRALQRVWLALARLGLYTHPLSEILDCPQTERELGSRLSVRTQHRLLCVFRVGRSEPPARSHRMR